MTPNEEQMAALRAYAGRNGVNWKTSLYTHWMRGTDDSLPQGWLFRQLRNSFGPEWLETFEFDK